MSTTPSEDFEWREALLDAWLEKQHQIARLQAESFLLLAERMQMCTADGNESPMHREAIRRSMIAEYSAAAHMAKGTVERAFYDAAFLERDHPVLAESFRSGLITAAHVHEVIEAGFVVQEAIEKGSADAATFALYETSATVAAESDTAMRTRALVRQIAAALAGSTVVERQKRATRERAVTVRSVGDGLALLQIVLPEHLAVAILDRLTQLAKQVIATRDEREPQLGYDSLDSGDEPVHPDDIDAADRDDDVIYGDGTFVVDPELGDDEVPERDIEHVPGDDRSLDEVRADIATDLLLASDPNEVNGSGLDNIRGRVQVTVASTTLAGEDDRPAELDGHGAMHPEAARALAGRTGLWTRLFLDPTGMVTETDAYSPTAEMKRFLRARDQHCRFPGCRMPIHDCQLDHNRDYAKGGRTALDNLCGFCVGHHSLKHPDIDERYRWTARQSPTGAVMWTSPLGRIYVDPPPRRVMFV